MLTPGASGGETVAINGYFAVQTISIASSKPPSNSPKVPAGTIASPVVQRCSASGSGALNPSANRGES